MPELWIGFGVVAAVAVAVVIWGRVRTRRAERDGVQAGVTVGPSMRERIKGSDAARPGPAPAGGAPSAGPQPAQSSLGQVAAMFTESLSGGPQGVPPGWQPLAASAHLAMEWRGVPFSLGGDAPTVSRAVTGTVRGFEAVAFEYTTLDRHSRHGSSFGRDSSFGHGNSFGRDHSTMHVVAVRLPVVLPTLEVSAEGLTGFLTRGFAGPDVEVGDPAFDAAFRVSTGEPRFAQEVLGPELRQWLLASARQPWRIEGRDVLTWRQGGQSIPRVLEDADRLATIAAAVPLHVLRAHGFSGGSA